MKKAQIITAALSVVVALTSLTGVAEARSGTVHVSGYFRKDGTYVHSYYRSAPNSTITDNWSYCGNVNPYTGKVGTIGCGGYTGGSIGTSSTSTYSPWDTLTTAPSWKPTTDSKHFTIGSTKQQVIDIMGKPDNDFGTSLWYGFSTINLDASGNVVDWYDPSKLLKTSVGEKKPDANPIAIGSTQQDVVDAMGTPDSIIGMGWYYGSSYVYFDLSGRVFYISNIGGNLKVQ